MNKSYVKCRRCGKETDEYFSVFTPNKTVEHLYVNDDGDCVGESYGIISRV